MPYIYAQVDDLEGTAKVGSKQCVALVQRYAGAPLASSWREGDAVVGHLSIARGTVIATFVDGRYPNKSRGNHTGFFVSQDSGGVWIMDQWFSDTTKPLVSKRYLRRKGMNKQGKYVDPSNNADAFSVVK